MIPKAFIEEIVRKTDIELLIGEYVDLSPVGAQLKGSCPFCGNKGTFTVSPDKQIYKCFKCGKGGSVVSFIVEYKKLSFPAAIRFLAEKLKLEVPEEE